MSDYSVTGVSFGDDAIEIIFLDEGEQTKSVGWLHTAYLAVPEDPFVREAYSALQALLVELVEYAYRLKQNEDHEEPLF